jgi:hypothetical protein
MPDIAEFYYQWWLARPLSGVEQFQYYGAYVLVALLFVASAGIFGLRRWARPLYLLMVVMLLIIEIPQTPMLTWGSATLLNNVSTLAMGAVLSIIFGPTGTHFFDKNGIIEATH